MQWGNSTVTMNPLISNENYTTATNTMAQWGVYLVPNLSDAPEFAYYVDNTGRVNGTGPPKLDQSQVLTMFEYDYTWYGLNNTYNAKLFAQLGNTEPE